MNVLKEQRVCIKFCQKLGETVIETYEILQQAFGETQWKTPSLPRPKKAKQVRSNVNSMLIAFFESEVLLHHEFLSQRKTVNQTVYITVLQRLREIQFVGNGVTNGLPVPGFCTTTMRHATRP
jgi:hypothetical protein